MPKICGEPRGEATGKELWTGRRRGGDQDVTLVTSGNAAEASGRALDGRLT
jgi:hypothetical protein